VDHVELWTNCSVGLYELGGTNFFSLASLANSLILTPHYEIRGAAPAQVFKFLIEIKHQSFPIY